LKTRRARISPAQVGLPEGNRRRTPGLRREEVAAIAGIGLTWYTWLEQGRPIQVSAQVLESLARTLMLNKEESNHLYALANQAPPVRMPDYRQPVNSMLQHVLDSLQFSPALILDIRWNIIAWNRAATVAFLDFSKVDIDKRNYIWLTFADDEYRQIFVNWELYAQKLLARFRASCGSYIEDPWLSRFVGELRSASSEFNQWWPMHNVENDRESHKVIFNKEVGEMIFEHTSFAVADNNDLHMFINTPLSGTETEDRVKELLKLHLNAVLNSCHPSNT
jgi:hypothetical protein